MPELPEVEIYKRYFAENALGRPIRRVDVRDERILGDIRPANFKRRLGGREFTAVRRHGKHFFADAGHGTWLHLHFGMSGDLAWYEAGGKPPRFARVIFDFADGSHLAYDDMRLFGVVDLTADPEAFIADHGLGPDPLSADFTLARLRQIAEGRRGTAKAFLMSQELIAGLGNLYVDETLFESSVHPLRTVDTLTPAELGRMHKNIRRILTTVIERKLRGAGYPGGYLIPHRELGEQCAKCGGEILRTVVSGRTTYYCGSHQK